MVEKASQTNHEPNGSVKPAVHSMITAERAQKFDLLIHLIVNFRRPLIVCGPEGIGKSTLLNVLREHRPVDGYYCELIGDQKLNFETIDRKSVV